jgi:Ti-type conjugative transfer relaxase TraA
VKACQLRLPTGLKATWARVTGKDQRLCQELANEAQNSAARERLEMQALIDRHLAERRAMDRDLTFLDAQQALEQELHDRAAAQYSPVYHLDPRQPLVLPREDALFTPNQLKSQPDLILAHISDKQARFTRTDILRGLAEFIDDPLDLRVASDRALLSPELVRVSDDKKIFTTRDFLGVEKQLSSRASEMAGSGGFKVNAAHIEQAIRSENTRLHARIGATLSDEQITAIHHILAPNQLSAVVGLASAGKSTLLSVARQAWERQDLRVHGAALAGKAADSLQSASGIRSRTLASLEASWKSGYEPVGCGDVVVIDEAGMVGTRQLVRIIEQLQMRGCKLVLVGDPDQLQPIQAGTPFRDIVDGIGAARLTEIRRQATNWQRDASHELAKGQTAQALQRYADHGAVHHGESRDQAIAKLVQDYMADRETNGTASRLAFAHRRVDVHAINQAIKAVRMAKGETPIETLFNTDHGPRAFAPGDRIIFTRNDATLAVRNGMLATVKSVGNNQLSVQFDPDEAGDRRNLTFSPKEFPSIDHGFAVSIHRSQGCTVDRSYVLSSRTLDENLTYVAMTRHKEKAGFYMAHDIASKQFIHPQAPDATPNIKPRAPSRTR